MSCDIRRSKARTRSLTPGEYGSLVDMCGRTSMPSSMAGSSGSSDGRSGGSGVAGVYGGGGGGGGRGDSGELSSVRVEMYEGSPRT